MTLVLWYTVLQGICLFCSVCDRFNQNSIADVLQQLWCLAGIDTGSSSKAAAILCIRYPVSRTRYWYFPYLTPPTLICGYWDEANLRASKITVCRSSARVWRVQMSYLCSIVAQRPGDSELDCVSAWCRCTGRDQTSMVVYTIITCTRSSM